MRCPRCNGFMIGEWFQDLRDDTGQFNFEGMRCLICGEVLDPIILQNRTLGPEGVPAKRKRRLSPAGVS